MHKLLALYRQPRDLEAFEQHYQTVHVPLVRLIPGLQALIVNHGIAFPSGGEPTWYLVAELHFAGEASFHEAMGSAENRAVGKDLRGFAGELATLMARRSD